jgi:hypothetical protein
MVLPIRGWGLNNLFPMMVSMMMVPFLGVPPMVFFMMVTLMVGIVGCGAALEFRFVGGFPCGLGLRGIG